MLLRVRLIVFPICEGWYDLSSAFQHLFLKGLNAELLFGINSQTHVAKLQASFCNS